MNASFEQGPTWRTWAVSIAAAVLLSLLATLLLCRSFRFEYDATRVDRADCGICPGSHDTQNKASQGK